MASQPNTPETSQFFYIVNELHYQNTKSFIKSLTYVFSTTFHRFVSILLDLDKFPIS